MMNARTPLAAASPHSSFPAVSSLPAPTWRDCLHMSPDVAAIVMGVTTAEAEARLRIAATRRNRGERFGDVAGDFKHSALAFITPGHLPMTPTYRLILNKPVSETYRCRGCTVVQPLPDSGLQPLCQSCSEKLRAQMEKEKKLRQARRASESKAV